MKVVIDTNVLVSAVIRDRLPEQVLLWCLGHAGLRWLVTPDILAEYVSVVRRPKFALPEETVTWWLELLAADTHLIVPSVQMEFPRDRKDLPFLICAESGRADYLITGDGDFSEAQRLIDARVVSVRQFAEALAPGLLVRPS